MKIVFWLSIFIVFWSYVGYYIFLRFISIFRKNKYGKREIFPIVSVIITAHNEEKRIGQKLENTLKSDYPHEKLEIIVASDHSTDRTVEIIEQFMPQGIILHNYSERHGKHYCQAEAVNQARGEIIIMTDATTFLNEDAIRLIVENFADPRIGVVSGMDKVATEDGEVEGEGLYVRYEMLLRSLESSVGSLIGASGSFYAIRKSICVFIYPDKSSDFYLPLIAFTKGFKSIQDERSIGFYKVLYDPSKEFERKVRTVVHGIDVLLNFKHILNPFKYGLYSIQIISHKLMRWLVPFALIGALLANSVLVDSATMFKITLLLQFLLYAMTFLAYLIKPLQWNTIFRVPYFFIMANYSILVAWIEYLQGERYITWQATRR
jgi:cellulose synthase/poly-beta-1,6-N-acetylglucosamine synthase-like glycosyltransferase